MISCIALARVQTPTVSPHHPGRSNWIPCPEQ